MAGHGGYRAGSGRKRAKSLAPDALETLSSVVYGLGDSLVLAGRTILPEATEAEAMRAAVAGIGHDNILAGNGMRVVELFAAGLERLTRAQPDGGQGGAKSLLESSLAGLPGQMGGDRAEAETGTGHTPDAARDTGNGAVDAKSSVPALAGKLRHDRPAFAPQGSLFPAFGPGAGGVGE